MILGMTCAHCDPYKTKAHFRFISAFREPRWLVKIGSSRAYLSFLGAFSPVFLKSMIWSGVFRETDALDDDAQLHNRSLVVVRAAKERGITIKAIKLFGKFPTNFFSANANGKKILFEGIPLLEVGYVQPIDLDDKSALKKILKDHGLPYAEGGAFRDAKAALRYAHELNFPLVVKPRSGSLSKHVTCGVRDEASLKEAVHVAQIVSRDFVVEEFVKGDVYRITVVNHKMLACCLRESPNVIGDGAHTINELMQIKNEDPRRGDAHKKNFTLHKIRLTPRGLSILAAQDFTPESVPPKGKKVYLHDKVVLACGADIHDKTDELHPDNRAMFLKLSRLLKAPIVGIDFICGDISRSYRDQKCAIIEANSLPYFDMHHYPTVGKPRDVARHIVDAMLTPPSPSSPPDLNAKG